MSDCTSYTKAEVQAERIIERISHGPLEFDTPALVELIREAMGESGGAITDHEAEELAESARLSGADIEQIRRELSEEYARDNRTTRPRELGHDLTPRPNLH